jgi:hypothetical protein
MEQIHIKVTPERKEKWQSYVDENLEFDNLSQLIRLSVEAEIDEDGGTQELDTEHLENQLDEIRGDIGDIETTVRAIDNTVVHKEEFEEFSDGLSTQIETEVETLIELIETFAELDRDPYEAGR